MNPNHGLAALDMINAFGEISRAEILHEVVDVLPELAPFLLQLWGNKGTSIHMNISACDWKSIVLWDGLFQGHNLSSLLFCLGLRRALRRFENQCVYGSVHLEYIDDVVLQFQPHLAHEVIPAFEIALKSVNLSLNHSKCKALIPLVLEEEG